MPSGGEPVHARAVRAYLDAAIEIVEAAGPIALRHFRRPLEVDDKSGGSAFDPVTRGDREVESFIRSELRQHFPDHGIEGEEEAARESCSAYRWVVDPIDGTRAFISGVPAWGILLGLVEAEACLAGVMHQPYLGETFFGGAGGAWMRAGGKAMAVRTRQTSELSSAILYCTHPSTFDTDEDRRRFERVAGASRMMRFGGDCYSYCLLALGQIDLVIEGSLELYNIIPLIPIVEGAGGVVTDGHGGSASGGGLVVAAANPKLHTQALETLNA